MATQPPPDAAWPQTVQQLYAALAASNAGIEFTFEHLEIVLPRDDPPGAPPVRWLLNGTLRLRTSADR